jgi:hypothetical protein
MKKQNDWIRYAVVIGGGKRNGKMSVVAVDIDAATIRLIEFQARKYQFGVVGLFCRLNIPVIAYTGGLLSAGQQQHHDTWQQKKGNHGFHVFTFVWN